MRQKIVRARHFILDLRKKIRIPAANFFYPREIYSNKRDRISRIGGSPPILSLTLSFDEKLSHRDPVCYRSSTPLLEFLDIPVYRSGRSARHSKTISRVDLRLPYVYVRDERVESVAGEEKSEGDSEEGEERKRGERVDRLLFHKSKLIHPALPYPSPTRIFPSSSSRVSRYQMLVLVRRNRESERENEFYYSSRSRQSNLASFHLVWSM